MASSFRILAGIVALALMSATHRDVASAFTAPRSSSGSARPSRRASPPRTASIYYPDGHDGVYDDAGYLPDDGVFGLASSPVFGQLAGQLSSDPSVTLTLARLASAFSPPGFAIDLANVNDVRCLAVDERHLEIEAVVCDDFQCSSLLVPVDFPEACNADDTLQDCVLRNVHSLDVAGEHILREREHVFAEESEARLAYEVLQSLDSEYLKSSPLALPAWWVPPVTDEDVSECSLLQSLLNGNDFGDMVRGLASSVLSNEGGLGPADAIRSAKVKALGPEGMVLKVHVCLNGKTYADDGGLNNEAVMDVPIRFSEMCYGQGICGMSIREQVLMIVETA